MKLTAGKAPILAGPHVGTWCVVPSDLPPLSGVIDRPVRQGPGVDPWTDPLDYEPEVMQYCARTYGLRIDRDAFQVTGYVPEGFPAHEVPRAARLALHARIVLSA